MVIAAGLFFASIASAIYFGTLVSTLNKALGGIISILFVVLGFIIGIILAAIVIRFIRYHIYHTYGFMTADVENRWVEFHVGENTKKVELTKRDNIESNFSPNGYKLQLSTGDGSLNLSQVFTGEDLVFVKFSADAHRRAGKGATSLGWKHPTDELTAAWLEIGLVRDGQNVIYNQRDYVF